MINKDLLYALKTRNKQMIKLLDDFANDIKTYSAEEGWMVIAETIQLVQEVPPTQSKYSHLIKAVNRAWLAFCEQSPEAATLLYDTVIQMLDKTSWTDVREAQTAYQLIYAFHHNHLRFPGANTCLHLALRQHSPRILGLIRRISGHSKQTLFALPVKPQTGTGADAIEMLLEIYFYHAGLAQGDDLRGQAAGLLLTLVQANPEMGNNITLSLLEYADQRSAVLSQLIDLYLTAGVHEKLKGMFFCIMLDLLDNSGSSFIYDDLDDITTQIEIFSRRWTSEQLDSFTRYAFYYGMNTDEDRRLLLSKSKKARRLAGVIVHSGHTGIYIAQLVSLLQSLSLPVPDAGPVQDGKLQFTDLNFKLLVINELMYRKGKLLPRFEIREFVRQYTSREIMLEKEGYDIIPEVRAYFECLQIPVALLAQVDTLAFDGGNEIYRQIFPYWDGECDSFDVISIEDIKLVPNLKRMSSMPSGFVARFGAEMAEKSIDVN